MNRAVFANDVVISDANAAVRFKIEGKILRGRADDCAMADKIASAHYDRSFDYHVRLDDAFFADDSSGPDDCVRPDLDIRAELRLLVDNRGFVNFHSTPASLKLK